MEAGDKCNYTHQKHANSIYDLGSNPPARGRTDVLGQSGWGKTSLLWKEGPYFQNHQVVITYTHKAKWPGYVPHFAGQELSSTIRRLRAAKPLRLVVLGDSISQGYRASGFFHVPPYQPSYPGLVANGLKLAYGSNIILKNLSVAGTTAQWGIQMAPKVVADRPNLVILAFGMNDAGGFSAVTFHQNLKRIIARIRQGCPKAQFIVVAPMTDNPEWTAIKSTMFPQYLRAIRQLRGKGIAVADITSI